MAKVPVSLKIEYEVMKIIDKISQEQHRSRNNCIENILSETARQYQLLTTSKPKE